MKFRFSAHSWALALAVAVASSAHAQPCGNFQPGAMSASMIRTEFSGAIFHLKVGGQPSGTAYLIESTRGYLLTANHVVKTASPASPITVETPRLPGQSLPAVVVKAHSMQDLVLLKLADPVPVSSFRAIDISLHFPNEDTPLYATGYPRFGDELGRDLNTQKVEVVATPDQALLQVKQAGAEGGASGGPLLDASGAAVATCLQTVGRGGTIARYVPMVSAVELLDDIPMSAAMATIDEQLRGGRLTEVTLRDKLRRSSTNPPNLDLYAWGRRIMQHQGDYAAVRSLVRCPLMQALIDRGMSDLVIDMTRFADRAQRAAATLQVARRELRLGSHLSATKFARTAEKEFAAAGDRMGLANAQVVLAAAQLELGLAAQAMTTMNVAYPMLAGLPVTDKGIAYVIAGRIKERAGNPANAASDFAKAYDAYQVTGNVVQAAEVSAAKADVNLRAGKYGVAQYDFEEAFKLYGKSNNAAGQSESLYKLAISQKASGQTTSFLETLRRYLNLFPAGKYSTEAARALREERP